MSIMSHKGAIVFGTLFFIIFSWRVAYTYIHSGKDPQTFRFASYYQDNMVLQAEPFRAIIWGYGHLNAKVEVSLNAYTTYKTVVKSTINNQGVWAVTFDPQAAGKRGIISASHLFDGKLELYSISNVVFGDVWFCGGQSNMLFPLGHVFNSTEELKGVFNYGDVRIFTASQEVSTTPLYNLKGILQNWAVPTPETAQYFSAVCWLYGRYLYDKLKRPLGLISSNWGGTRIETWSSARSLTSCGIDFKTSDKDIVMPHFTHNRFWETKVDPPSSNSVLWNAMVHPFLNMTIKGVIWYQGEANAKFDINLYNCTFPAMIKDWRQSWYEATGSQTEQAFPFGFVQLSTFNVPEDGKFPVIRWHQTGDVGHVPNPTMPKTFMAVALDLPDPDSPYGSIHPRDKQDVSRRLSAEALKYVYKAEMVDDGPFPTSASFVTNTVRIVYSAPNLKVVNTTHTNFDICCEGSECDFSDLSPQSQSEWLPTNFLHHDVKSVTLSATACPKGVKRVRYAWATVPCDFKRCQIYNRQDFPAPPFVMDVKSK